MDMLAEKVGMDPLEFRKRNSLQPGQSCSTGMVYTEWPFPELCDAIKPAYDRARKEAAAFKDNTLKRGVGIAAHAGLTALRQAKVKPNSPSESERRPG